MYNKIRKYYQTDDPYSVYDETRGSYEEELINARQNAIIEMEQRAQALGANAVVGVDIDYEVLGADNGMLMVTASGTAVFVE